MEEPKLPSIQQLLENTWKTFSIRPLGFITVFGIPTIPIVIFAALIGFLMMVILLPIYGNSQNTELFSPVLIGLITLLVLIVLPVMIICSLWQNASSMIYTAALANGNTMSIKQALKDGWSKKGAIFKTGFIYGLAVSTGFLFFFIPGIIFSLWFVGAMWITIEENIVGRPALLKSKTYVHGRMLAILGRFLVLFLVLIGVAIFSSIIEIIPLLGPLVSLVINIITTPLILIYSYHVYTGLKSTRPNPPVYAKNPTWLNLSIWLGVIAPIIFIALWIAAMGALLLINPKGKFEQANDARRMADFGTLTTAIRMYQAEKDVLPTTLTELVTNNDITTLPTDPETKKPYSYQNGVLCVTYKTKPQQCEDFNNQGYPLETTPIQDFTPAQDPAYQFLDIVSKNLNLNTTPTRTTLNWYEMGMDNSVDLPGYKINTPGLTTQQFDKDPNFTSFQTAGGATGMTSQVTYYKLGQMVCAVTELIPSPHKISEISCAINQ